MRKLRPIVRVILALTYNYFELGRQVFGQCIAHDISLLAELIDRLDLLIELPNDGQFILPSPVSQVHFLTSFAFLAGRWADWPLARSGDQPRLEPTRSEATRLNELSG
jgi:hypothetical protein